MNAKLSPTAVGRTPTGHNARCNPWDKPKHSGRFLALQTHLSATPRPLVISPSAEFSALFRARSQNCYSRQNLSKVPIRKTLPHRAKSLSYLALQLPWGGCISHVSLRAAELIEPGFCYLYLPDVFR